MEIKVYCTKCRCFSTPSIDDLCGQCGEWIQLKEHEDRGTIEIPIKCLDATSVMALCHAGAFIPSKAIELLEKAGEDRAVIDRVRSSQWYNRMINQ